MTTPTLTSRLARLRVPLGFASAVVVLYLARPETAWLAAGAAVAAAGEALRVWAAGHLEKSREVTASGPYRFLRHPLYAGSTLMGVGLAVASRSLAVAIIVAVYIVATIGAAIRNEEAFLRGRFGGAYDAYASGGGPRVSRRWALDRVLRNREWRAWVGFGVVFGLLAIKARWG